MESTTAAFFPAFSPNDGLLQPLSETGTFTLHLLYLNRLPLVEYRQKRQQDQELVEALTHLQALVRIYE